MHAAVPHDPLVRADLPTGTVTFVFTDVEGSTALLEELGTDTYAALLLEHHRTCRKAWAAHAGVEVDTAGDAFFVAFGRATDALAAAAAAQEGLAAGGVRVRMGVHTGEVALSDTGFCLFTPPNRQVTGENWRQRSLPEASRRTTSPS